MDSVILKISADGTSVLWATYYGGTGTEDAAAGIAVHNPTKNVYALVPSNSAGLATPGIFSQGTNFKGGTTDFVAVKFSADGKSRLWAGYLGGSASEPYGCKNIMVEQSTGNVVVAAPSASSDLPVTTGAFQTTPGGGAANSFVSKISADGATLIGSTYISGNSAMSNVEGFDINSRGEVVVGFGLDTTLNFPVSSDAFQPTFQGTRNGGIAVLSSDLTNRIYATYFGNGYDEFRALAVDSNDNIIAAGHSTSGSYRPFNALYPNRIGIEDGTVVKFSLSADATPPSCSNGQPTGTLPAGTAQATLSLNTNEAAVCRYSSSPGVAYTSMTSTFSSTGGISHSTLIPGLQDGQSYSYYVKCQDLSGNPNTNDFPISFSVASPGPTCQNQGYSCCSSCQSGPHTQYDSSCSGQVCCDTCTQPQTNLCSGLVLLHHYDNNPTYGESATKAYDFSGNGNNGTVSGATWNATGGKFAGAYEFNPSNSATINLSNPPSLNNLGPMTISMWIRPKQTDAYILSKRNGGGDWRIDIAATGSSGWYRGFSGTDPMVATNNGVITFNQLQHLVFAWDGNADVTAPAPAGAHYYINGVEPGYQSRTNGTGTKDNDASSLLFLASRAGTGVFFNGSIDELAIWNRSLSSQEIQSLYSSGSPISCQTCIHKSDSNCDGCISTPELNSFIDRWKYNNLDVNIRELVVAIGLYNINKGC